MQEAEKVPTNLKNVALVVYQKKDSQIMNGLKKNNFAVFADGMQKEITNFSTPERPIAVALVLEYSKLGAVMADNTSLGFGAVTYSLIEPAGQLISQLIKSPDDYVAVIAFDMRPTPMTDLTNDPKRIDLAVNLLLRNRPVLREAALFDALKLILVGGRYDSAVLDEPKEKQSEHIGLGSVQGKRKAMILISSGLDTFSKTNYTQARKIIQDAGVPIYVIGTVGMFQANANSRLSDRDRRQLKQAEAQLNTIALETGGAYYPYMVESDAPGIIQSISARLRGQYSLAFRADEIHDGKPHNIVVKVDVDGDGVYDEQNFVVQARQVYNAPKN